MNETRIQFTVINGLRGIAAFIVAAYHTSLNEYVFTKNGFLAVDLFYVLSGFVISYAYKEKLMRGMKIVDFYFIRMIRLYPLYILGSTPAIAAFVASSMFGLRLSDVTAHSLTQIPTALLMLPSQPLGPTLSAAPLYPFSGAAWTLFYEIIINLLYAVTVTFWTIRRLIALVAASAACLSLVIIFDGSVHGGWNWASIHIGMLRVICSFGMGVLIHSFWQSGVGFIQVPPLLIVAVFMLALQLPEAIVEPACILFVFPVITALAVYSRCAGLTEKIFAYLGAASYCIYCVHPPVRAALNIIFQRMLHLTIPAADIVLLIIIVPLSVFIDAIYDVPFRSWLAQLHKAVHYSYSKI